MIDTANKITADNAGWLSQFRFAVGIFWSGVSPASRSTSFQVL
jgi:hypothetical protein